MADLDRLLAALRLTGLFRKRVTARRDASGSRLYLLCIFPVIVTLLAAGAGLRAAADTSGAGAGKSLTSGDACPRPYSATSPWNTPIGTRAAAPDSGRLISTISQPLTSDPTEYTFPLYIARRGQSTPPVAIENIASIVIAPRKLHRTGAGLQLRIPLPPNAQPSDGGDHQLILWNPLSGDEWGFWQFNNSTDPITQSVPAGVGTRASPLPVRNAYADYWTGGQIIIGRGTSHAEKARIVDLPDSGHMILARRTRWSHQVNEQVWGIGASNGYHYNTGWSGVPPRGFSSRGAGLTYLTGLVRKCEIEQGHIDHALAFVYPYTTAQFVYPATKSDGNTPSGRGLPEGSRLQLDPSVSDRVIKYSWGCRRACFTIAKALQRYGMYLVDTGGHPKIVVEDERTAHWRGEITASTVTPIPVTSFRLVR